MQRDVTVALEGLRKYSGNPILSPQGNGWESKDVFNPAAVVKDNQVYLLYRAEDRTGVGQWNGTSRIGLAISHDGLHFERQAEPVIDCTEDYEYPGGCEDPRITLIEGVYYLTYTAFDGRLARLCSATSDDLVHWTKHGPMVPDFRLADGRPWTKSGAILPEPIDGRYVMYFGDSSIWLATSEDLLHWAWQSEPVLSPRADDDDAFDSVLVEPGPSPFLSEDGIVLVYNGASPISGAHHQGSERIRYATGLAVFDAADPARLLHRSVRPTLEPTADQELAGQVDNVVFAEGLVTYGGRWFLYYGMADSHIGVASGVGTPAESLRYETDEVARRQR